MFRNHLFFAVRLLFKNKLHSFINMSGLTIGIACSLLIMSWVMYELSFDKFHENYDNISRVEIIYDYPSGTMAMPSTPAPLATAVLEGCPEITNSTRFRLMRKSVMEYDKNYYQINRPALVDPSFLEIFTFPLIYGDKRSVLSDKYSVVLTETFSHNIFGEINPLGKTLRLGKTNLTVTGVLKQIPQNSHLNFGCLMPFALLDELSGESYDSWHITSCHTYVAHKPNARIRPMDENITEIYISHHGDADERLYLSPLKNIHLHHGFLDFIDPGEKPGDIKYVYIFSVLALFLLIVASINFINLTTAHSEGRIKEISMRKINGAHQSDLIRQFLCESALTVFISAILAIALVEILLPAFGKWSGVTLTQNYIININIVLALAGIIIFVGFLSGAYPALYLSSLNPEKILRGSSRSYCKGLGFRRVLVLFQFIITIFAIICSLTISRQNEFIREINLGYNSEDLVYMPMDNAISAKYEAIKGELLNQPGVIAVTRGIIPMEIVSSTTRWDWEGKNPDEEIEIHPMMVEYGYIEALGLEILEGRSFSEKFPSDRGPAFIINEAAAEIMGLKSPVGRRVALSGLDGEIIGMIKDFHYGTVRSRIGPVILHITPIGHARYHRYLCVRYKPDDIAGTIAFLKGIWQEFAPESPFQYRFLGEKIASAYLSEKRMSDIFNNFTIWSIFISCLGLIGLTSFAVRRRTREIGIRKVLGASAPKIVILLSRESARLVIMANIIAWPLAWFALTSWLKGFAYRADLDIVIPLLSAVSALCIALISISVQALRAALAKPVNSLRQE